MAHIQQKQPVLYLASPRRNEPMSSVDNDSCATIETDLSDDDDDYDSGDYKNSYLSSTDDYHVDYSPNKIGRQSQVRFVILSTSSLICFYNNFI